MLHRVSVEEIEALKPDAASLQAAKGLLNLTHWSNLGESEAALWGECKGSGSKPYLVQMRVADSVFKCTCPSRKFPCKHSLALGLIYIQHTENFSNVQIPTWVQKWLDDHLLRNEKKVVKQEQPLSEVEQQKKNQHADKRRLQRNQRLQDGLDELQLWLFDQIRHGLGRLPQQLGQIKQIAARMVDAQMPLVAKRLYSVHDIVGIQSDWTLQTLRIFGQLQLLIEAFSRFEQLSSLEQADLLEALGISTSKEALPETVELVRDNWLVLSVTFLNTEKQLWRRMVWLQGQSTQRYALLLEFNFGGRVFTPAFLVGQVITGTCTYMLSQYPLRANFGDYDLLTLPARPSAKHNISECLQVYANQLANNPWTWVSPWLLKDSHIHFSQEHGFIVSDEHHALSLKIIEPDGWYLLAVAGTYPVDLFAEYVDGQLTPLSAWRQHTLLWKNEALLV